MKEFIRIFCLFFSGIAGVLLLMADSDSTYYFVGSKLIGIVLVVGCMFYYIKHYYHE
jgi:hypothetical protein